MTTSRFGALALGCVAVVALGSPLIANAEEESPLNPILDARAKGNDDSASVQKRIDEISDENDRLLGMYRTTLKQIDSIDSYNTQLRALLESQEKEIESLVDQVGRVRDVSRSVTPLMLRMVTAIEEFVRLDVPFLIDERTKRAEALRELMTRADVTTPEKFRQVMEAYQIENEYGRTIEAYRDTIAIEGNETVVDVLRFGRIALVYQSLDETKTGRWDQEARTWTAVDANLKNSVRDGIRIARKQVAPDLVKLPLPAPTAARGENR